MGILLRDCEQLLTMKRGASDIVGQMTRVSLLIEEDRIVAVGDYDEIVRNSDKPHTELDCRGKVVLPGYVDSHTHLVYGASRLKEYVARLQENRPAELKKLVGKIGLESSIDSTKRAGFEGLVQTSIEKLEQLLLYGVTTVEIKSGYGIDKDTELEQLRVVKKLKELVPQTLYATYLGAHYWDEEMGKEKYIDFMIREVMPLVEEEQLADFCDVWCDDGYYTAEEAKLILEAGRSHGMIPTIHTDCYSYIGGSEMAAKIGAVSVDHLNYLPDEVIPTLVQYGVVGTVLPGTDFSVKHPKPFRARPMLDGGMDVALATNLNPGNWMESMQLVIAFACRNHGMTPEEALVAATRNGAKALKAEDEIGTLEIGKYADIQIWDTDDYQNVCYKLGGNLVETVIKHGKIVVQEGKVIRD